MEQLPDGTYDVMVVDVDTDAEGPVRVDVVITTGSRKGEVVSLRTPELGQEPLTLMGLPATLRVSEGRPALHPG